MELNFQVLTHGNDNSFPRAIQILRVVYALNERLAPSEAKYQHKPRVCIWKGGVIETFVETSFWSNEINPVITDARIIEQLVSSIAEGVDEDDLKEAQKDEPQYYWFLQDIRLDISIETKENNI